MNCLCYLEAFVVAQEYSSPDVSLFIVDNSMSSELIGELGQVGLKIGDSTSSALNNSDDCFINDDKKKPRLSSGHRSKKFRPAWMMFDIFKDWLRPHTSPEFATCIVCNRVIKAGKSELEKHAAGKRHQMLRCTNPQPRAATAVLIDQDLISQEEIPVTISINENRPESGTGASTGAATVDDYSAMPCMDTANYSSSFTGDSRGSDTFSQNTPRPPPAPVQPPPPHELLTKAIVSKASPGWKATAIVNGHVTRLDLADYRGRYLILFFYPQDFNRTCASEINALSDRIGEFRATHAEVVACSVDSHLCHLAWAKMPRSEGGVGNPKIPLLADPTHTIAKDYGVLIPEKGHTLRATFVIDKRGQLRVMNVYDSLIGRGIDELLRTVRALRYSDETEEAAPADWSPPRAIQCTQNDNVDKEAKSAAMDDSLPISYNKTPTTTIKYLLKQNSLKMWNEQWTKSTKGRQLYSYIKTIEQRQKLPYFDYKLTQILTGHGGAKSYLYRFRLTENNKCKCDMTSEQTYDHLLFDCELLNRQRVKFIKSVLTNGDT